MYHRIALPFVLVALMALLVPASAVAQDGGLRTAVQKDLRTRFYPGENTRHVMEEAARIFELAQAGYRVVYGKRGVIAHREWGWETIVDESLDLDVGGAAYWYVSLVQEETGVVVQVRCVSKPDPHTPLDPEAHQNRPGDLVAPATMDQTDMQPDEDHDAEALYAVFFNRLDVLLGQNRFWLYCRAGEEFAKMERLNGTLDAWCFEAGDQRPGLLAP